MLPHSGTDPIDAAGLAAQKPAVTVRNRDGRARHQELRSRRRVAGKLLSQHEHEIAAVPEIADRGDTCGQRGPGSQARLLQDLTVVTACEMTHRVIAAVKDEVLVTVD